MTHPVQDNHIFRTHGGTDALLSKTVNPVILLEGRQTVAAKDVSASQENNRLIENRRKSPALRAKAKYLLRDILKVVGNPGVMKKADAALFYADPKDPMKGGTGYILRVCRMQGVPYALQDEWVGLGGVIRNFEVDRGFLFSN